MSKKTLLLVFTLTLLISGIATARYCKKLDSTSLPLSSYSYLALGDSYTIGESVVESDRWPTILQKELNKKGLLVEQPKIIAKTGWRTDDMLSVAKNQIGDKKYAIVSLLIGVNNEFQGQSPSEFEPQFRACLEYAIAHCSTDKSHIFVVSIPDYGYTPYGNRKKSSISPRIDAYNEVCKRISAEYKIAFYDITPISRTGLTKKSLVAADGLHPSGKQYKLWVNQFSQTLFDSIIP